VPHRPERSKGQPERHDHGELRGFGQVRGEADREPRCHAGRQEPPGFSEGGDDEGGQAQAEGDPVGEAEGRGQAGIRECIFQKPERAEGEDHLRSPLEVVQEGDGDAGLPAGKAGLDGIPGLPSPREHDREERDGHYWRPAAGTVQGGEGSEGDPARGPRGPFRPGSEVRTTPCLDRPSPLLGGHLLHRKKVAPARRSGRACATGHGGPRTGAGAPWLSSDARRSETVRRRRA
jgi:hypothetical protein